MASLFLAGGLFAAPLAGPGLQPVAAKPILTAPEAPSVGIDSSMLRDQVYTAAKELGAPADVLGPAMDRITSEGSLGNVDMASVNDVTATIADYDIAMKVEKYLLGYSEVITLGALVDGVLPDSTPNALLTEIKLRKLGSGVGTLPGNDLPRNGGTCLTCPSFDFGPFTPTAAWQFHSEATDTNADCNLYSFNVTNGVTYEFSLCTADGGACTWDSRLTGYNASGCAQVFDNDDSCGLQSKFAYTSTFTGTLIVRLKGWQTAAPWDFGSYTLAYRSVSCSSCAAPIGTLPTPTSTCQIATGTVNATCPNLFWFVQLTAGATYTFTTCPAVCSGTSCTSFNDTVLELYAPTSTACTTAAGDRVAVNDDAACTGFSGLRSTFTYVAPTTGLYKIKARAFSSSTVGTICMGYIQTAGGGCTNNCSTGPFLTTLIPSSVCQTHSASVVSPCQDTWYLVSAGAAGQYEFTTCTAPVCAGGNAAFDSILELYNSSCALLASDNDGCGAPRSNLTFNIPAAGTYKLRVRSATGSAGAYTLTYRTIGIACTAPSGVAITPTSGTAASGINTCTIAQTFNVTSSGTAVMTYNWTITPPAGGTAAPSAGAALGGAGATNPGSFTSTLTREGNFTVGVTAVNACGSSSNSITYQLRDLTAPSFPSFPANTTVQCTAVPPAPVLSASDNCDPNPVETFSQVTTPGSCPGRYTITRTWTARDRAGNTSAPRSQVITVVDTTPPVIVPDTTYKYCIYPPNHELVCFLQSQFSPVITDDCSNPVTWKFAGILSSEAAFPTNCGDGNIDPDSIVAPDGSGFCVRSERCGQDPSQNDGRVYLLLATATDACGNTSQPTAIGAILVPHDNADTSNCIYP